MSFEVTDGNTQVTGPNRRVALGVYRTPYGWRLFARVNGVLLTRRIRDQAHTVSIENLSSRREAWTAALTRGRRVRGYKLVLTRAELRDLVAKLPARFREKMEPSRTCWLWVGALAQGYGRFWFKGRTRQAHVVAYEHCIGPVPAGCELDHLCRVRRCVNPRHVEPVPHRVNVLRGEGWSAAQAKRSMCVEGHPLVQIGPQRRCPICRSSRAPSRWRRRQCFVSSCWCGCGRPLLPGLLARRGARYLPFHKPRQAPAERLQ